MKNKQLIYHNLKRAIPTLCLLLLFSICSYGQKMEKTSLSSKSEQTKVLIKETTQLNQVSQNAKTLFEKAHDVSLTNDQYVEKVNSTQKNLAKWKEVLQYFKDDSTADLSLVRKMVKAMNQKSPLMN